jgi:proteasome lid subunit RPN8/RPN11
MIDLPANTIHGLVALANSIQEICGYVLDDGSFIVMPNISDAPMDSYEVNPESQGWILPMVWERVVAMFHTHPRGICWPSDEDMRNWPPAASEGGARYFIVTAREVREFRLDEDGKPKPVG